MTFSSNALTILEKRYLVRDDKGRLAETPEQMFERVALTLAESERKYGGDDLAVIKAANAFFYLMWYRDFMPNSPTLANAGARTGQLSACFVLPVEDDLGSIFETIKNQVLIHQTGGGTGFSFSRLRHKDDVVNSTKGKSSGPVSFMDAFNVATETVKQGGMRRGANMGILRIDHPDVLEFVRRKEDLSKLTNFNVSVAVTNAFMDAVEAGTDYALISPRTGEEVGRLDAREVFGEIVVKAWKSGEPGLVFIDRMNEYCPVPWMGQYEATNPCGEQPLIPYESCNLGSINLERFVEKDDAGKAVINWPRLKYATEVSTHLLDNVIDANRYPIPQLKEVADATRKIGLGVMGFARMLFKLGIPYGSPESLVLAEQVMSFIDYHSKRKSIQLAAERGRFPASVGHEDESFAIHERWFIERSAKPNRHPDADYEGLVDALRSHGIRNSTTTTIAPTGTISMIADCSSGCEPVFALAFKRWQADTNMVETDPVFAEHLAGLGFSSQVVEAIVAKVADNEGTLHGLEADFPEDVVALFRTAHDISPEEHVEIQAAFQAFNDSATSKTINFAESATVDDVMRAYRHAWATGCKGITVYRNNSRQFQPLSVAKKDEAKPAEVLVAAPVQAEPKCENCGSDSLYQSEGCKTCTCCGWSACSVA